ncbi:hypothetical protein [Panacibacter ginsenosidivorans]|uniref:hypothetical protein n=1 Tax=Panacibacter ginsenosidivorans TaxID=1813871 RepID=UPI001315A14F|nr:hypothetical protein [Panacibacter ginsenosidivorans]
MKKIILTVMLTSTLIGFTACSEPKPAPENSMDSSNNKMQVQPDTSAMHDTDADTLQ